MGIKTSDLLLKMEKQTANKLRIHEEYLAYSLSILTVFASIFIFYHRGYLMGISNNILTTTAEQMIAVFMMGSGLLKMYGVYSGRRFIKRIAIYMLSFIWGALAVVAFYYSFGVGYPSIMFLFVGRALSDCIRLSMVGFKK